MVKKKFSYIGERYAQGDSELELVSFCAPVQDIKKWGGVPSKQERYHGGFQRALGKRYTKIKKFFDDGQASPTSVVVAFREGILEVNDLAYPSSWVGKSELSSSPNHVLLSFEVELPEDGEHSLDELRSAVCAMLKPRVESSSEPNDSEQEANSEEESRDEESNDVEGREESEEEDSDEELDVGHSKLKAFYDFISDDQAVLNWIEAEKANSIEEKSKKKKRVDPEFGQATPEEKLTSILVSLLRPAMIVDGQHRVWGAYHSDQAANIKFSINAIKDADWVEQVFQFVVLNKLAKPISSGFLTSILNTSLTNEEVGEIESRLEKIGIKNIDRKIIKYLNHNLASPFYGSIAEPGEVVGIDNKGKLSDKGMIKLAKRWFNLQHPDNKNQLMMFRQAIGAKNYSDARKKWKNYDVWFSYFYAFWGVIKDRYESDGMWVKKEGFHLLYIVNMHAMQDLFLTSKAEGDSEFTSIDDFRAAVEKFFQAVPSPFFTGWEATGLQSGDGPTDIKNAIKMLRAGKDLATVKDESDLFKKKKKS